MIEPRVSTVLEGIHDAHAVTFKELLKLVEKNPDTNSHKKGEGDTQLLEAAETLEKENQKLKSERENILREFEQERNELIDQLNSLQEENSKYLDQIIKHSKDNADHNLGKGYNDSKENKPSKQVQQHHEPRPQSGQIGQYESFAGNVQQKPSSVY
jgi:hypothetical protein